MKRTHRKKRLAWPKGLRKSLWVIPGIGLLVKVIIIAQIPGNAWLGADGENYLKGLEFLLRDGFLSTESILHYWPAGYPLLMWVLGWFTPQLILPIMAILQSFLYAFAAAYFSQKLNETTLKKYSVGAAIILTCNPTLALNTVAIGYELISASIFLIVIGIFISGYQSKIRKVWSWQLVVSGGLFSITNFVQPRFALSALIYFGIFAFLLYPRKIAPLVVIIGMSISLLLPSILLFRNVEANRFATVSTNLGVAMQLGAGKDATGGYVPSFPGLKCPEVQGNAAEIDSARVSCVVKWYVDNPGEILRLGWNKSVYFWSPWFGPLANGSMARNPWIKLNPFYDVATETQEGNDLVYGSVGRFFSWVWLFGYLATLFMGLRILWRSQGLSKNLSILLTLLITSNWLVSLGTLGDHRQRLPILTMIVFVQVIGLSSISKQIRKSRK